MDKHTRFMLAAVEEAAQGMDKGYGKPFGSVIVKDDQIIASACNEIHRLSTPTAHAELTAIAKACQQLGTLSLEGCTIYASGQPCPMCLAAIHLAGIRTVYYANTYEQAKTLGFIAEPLVDSLCAVFAAPKADPHAFVSTALLNIVHLPLPQAAALYERYKQPGA